MPERPVKSSEPSATGCGHKVINPELFDPAMWEPKLSTEEGQAQYREFVDLVMERIRSKQSSPDETKSFAHFVAMKHNPDFMTVTIPYLSELKKQL